MLGRVSSGIFLIAPRQIMSSNYSGYSVSLKRIREKVFERQQYYYQNEMQSAACKIDSEHFKVYVSARSPEVIRTGQKNYQIVQNLSNFYFTFLDNLDYMGTQFSWQNRKYIGLKFEDIINMEKIGPNRPVTVKNAYSLIFNNETTNFQKQILMQVLSEPDRIKLSLSIFSDKDGDKWQGVYELPYNDYLFLVKSAKKHMYFSSGLKTMIELQKRQIIRQMQRRIVKDQQKHLTPSIQFDVDRNQLLSEMSDFQTQHREPKSSKTNKKTKSDYQ